MAPVTRSVTFDDTTSFGGGAGFLRWGARAPRTRIRHASHTAPAPGCATRISIRERVRPLVDPARAGGDAQLLRVDRVVTDEGEFAAVLAFAAPDATGQRVLGVVLGDDFYTRVEASSVPPDEAPATHALVTRLVRELPLGLGRVRPRVYPVTAPRGWRAEERTRVTRWHSPDGATLTVDAALPLELSEGALARRLRHGDAAAGFRPLARAPIGGPSGLRGELVEEGRGEARRFTASLADGAWRYVLRLDGAHRHLPALRGVIDSIVVIPGPRVAAPVASHWVD
jgi:hypothetical protein